MTPVQDVFTMSADRIMDEVTMNEILGEGYSRIPIHAPSNKTDFVGMLLVKVLITYDPEDCWPVSEFSLATLPETAPTTSCLDILNFFQEGRAHMVLVSSAPGENHGALGVLTLEDVIEELIGEEIVDETDVYVDVHKHLRRIHPSTLALQKIAHRLHPDIEMKKAPSAGPVKPSNRAQEPLNTTSTKVKIKHGSSSHPNIGPLGLALRLAEERETTPDVIGGKPTSGYGTINGSVGVSEGQAIADAAMHIHVSGGPGTENLVIQQSFSEHSKVPKLVVRATTSRERRTSRGRRRLHDDEVDSESSSLLGHDRARSRSAQRM